MPSVTYDVSRGIDFFVLPAGICDINDVVVYDRDFQPVEKCDGTGWPKFYSHGDTVNIQIDIEVTPSSTELYVSVSGEDEKFIVVINYDTKIGNL